MKVIVISGANLYSGGTLSILQDCVKFLDTQLYKHYKVFVIVNDINKFNKSDKINFIELKNSRKSYLHRLYYEFFYFLKISKKLQPYFWLSLNDISPNIISEKRAVYCHNPSPFRKVSFKDLYFQKQLFFFTLFYKFLYQINIKKNNYVVVQQNWIRNSFCKMFSLSEDQVILFPPQTPNSLRISEKVTSTFVETKKVKTFFYPTMSRPFKNIELICEAIKILKKTDNHDIKVIITIDGTENNYSKNIIKKYSSFHEIDFIGYISREEVFKYYDLSDCLIFPSTLETWGLPITEFKLFGKPIILSDLEYAHETLGNYDKCVFINPFDPFDLASKLKSFLNDEIVFQPNSKINYKEPIAHNWDHFFKIVLD